MKSDMLDDGRSFTSIYSSQDPVYSNNESQSQPINFRCHQSDIRISLFSPLYLSYFFLSFLSLLLITPSFYFILFLILYFLLCRTLEKPKHSEEAFLKYRQNINWNPLSVFSLSTFFHIYIYIYIYIYICVCVCVCVYFLSSRTGCDTW